MPVERVDYYFNDEYQQALQQEQKQEEEEPDVVPCFKCGCQMYQISDVPNENLCKECYDKKIKPIEDFEKMVKKDKSVSVEGTPF